MKKNGGGIINQRVIARLLIYSFLGQSIKDRQFLVDKHWLQSVTGKE